MNHTDSRRPRWAASLAIVRIVAVWLLVQVPIPTAAGDFEAAVRAAEAGDFATALREFRALAAIGDPRGENGLGVLYLRGNGLERNLERAVALIRSAAEKGLRAAEKNLGELYAEGVGVSRDDPVAAYWLGLAAAKGDPGAQLSLGMMHVEGRGIARDHARAMQLFRKSADQGNAEAQANIGHLYRAGYGVERDYVLAYAWYGVAAASGFNMGPELRESVAILLTSSQIEQGRSIARGIWKKLEAQHRPRWGSRS